jgi:hypothetical protein
MARTRRTTCKSTGQLPIGQLAPRDVPQPQESQPDAPEEASQEEEPFEIELVVPESPMTQDSPTEEQQQPKEQDVEDKANKEYPSLSDAEDEKMYRDADEVETWASPPLPGTGSRKSQVQDQGSPTSRAGGVQSCRRDFSRIQSPLPTQGTSFRTSRSDAVADAARQAITSWVYSNKHRL